MSKQALSEPQSPTPTPHDDGRNFARDLAIATGEGAQMEIRSRKEAFPASESNALDVAITPMPGDDPTYYDQPVVKEPVWIWTIPTYFFTGGIAGAAATLAMVAEFTRPKRLHKLVRWAHFVSAAGDALSAVLLISDLGRPSRFLNMMRVFRPTSPMSVGSWVLAFSGGASATAFLFSSMPGALGAFGKLGTVVSGMSGLPLAGYTAVLITNSATPAWAGAYRMMPVLFVASATATAGSLLSLLPLDRASHRVAQRFGAAGKIAELGAALAVEHELSSNPRAQHALKSGLAGALWTAARVGTAASLALSLLPGTSKTTRRVAGALGLLGGLALRFAVFRAGKASARDPRATFHAQRHSQGGAPAGRDDVAMP